MIKNILIFMFLVMIFNCNNSKFSGTSSRKAKSAAEKTNYVEISTEATEQKIEDPSPEDPGGLCFEDPIPLPEELTEPVELYNWKATGSTAEYTNVMVTPVVGKIIGEKPSIVVVAYSGHSYESGSYVYAIEGATGKQQWVSDFLARQVSPAIGDIDGDNNNEVVVVGHDNYLYALNGEDGKIRWKTEVPIMTSNSWDNWRAYSTSLADIDDDNLVEIVAAGQVFEGKTGKLKFKIITPWIMESIIGKVNGTEDYQVVIPSGIYSGKNGDELCKFSSTIEYMGFAKLREVDEYVTIVGTEPYGSSCTYIKAFRGDNCQEVFSTPFTGGGFGGLVTIADYDGDKELEIGVPGVNQYTVLNSDGSVLWQTNTYDGADWLATGSTTFDFNGDGKNEVIYNSVGKLRVFNGKDGKVLYETINSNFTITETPVVVDIDADGHAEIIVVASLYSSNGGINSGVRVFKSPENNWIGTRQIWNQAAYSITNVSDDGKVAGFDEKSIWQKYVGQEYLLGFRNNLPLRPTKKCE